MFNRAAQGWRRKGVVHDQWDSDIIANGSKGRDVADGTTRICLCPSSINRLSAQSNLFLPEVTNVLRSQSTHQTLTPNSSTRGVGSCLGHSIMVVNVNKRAIPAKFLDSLSKLGDGASVELVTGLPETHEEDYEPRDPSETMNFEHRCWLGRTHRFLPQADFRAPSVQKAPAFELHVQTKCTLRHVLNVRITHSQRVTKVPGSERNDAHFRFRNHRIVPPSKVANRSSRTAVVGLDRRAYTFPKV